MSQLHNFARLTYECLVKLPVRGVRHRLGIRKKRFGPEQVAKKRYVHCSVDRPPSGSLAHFAKGPVVFSGWTFDTRSEAPLMVRIRVDDRVYTPHPKVREDVARAFRASLTPPEYGFESLVQLSPGLHLAKVEAQDSDGTWNSIYRTYIFSLLQPGLPSASIYPDWVQLTDSLASAERSEILDHIEHMMPRVSFSVLVDCRHSHRALNDTLNSISRQIYPDFDLHVLLPEAKGSLSLDQSNIRVHDRFDAMLEAAAGDFLCYLRTGDVLSPTALYEFASRIALSPDLDLVYADEDQLNAERQRQQPFFKPDWSPDYLETLNYIGVPACFRKEKWTKGTAAIGYYDFILRFTEETQAVSHVPKVLCHRPEQSADVIESESTDELAALERRLERTGRTGKVMRRGDQSRYYEIELTLPSEPLVSIIIPTAGKTVQIGGKPVNLLVQCISRIREISTYTNYEFVIVHNGDLSDETYAVVRDERTRFVLYSDPVFNIAKKLNLGGSAAAGEYFLLINDDIWILTPNWIERMLEQFAKPHVGVVGVKLIYPDLTTQHVGVVYNSGNPDHVRRLFPRDDLGYFFSTSGIRNYSAVTGACMMTPGALYKDVGGFSEEFAISYNDVDYCLKVAKRSKYAVYNPFVEIIHFESQSRIPVLDPIEAHLFHAKWAAETTMDPFYNERFLDVVPPTFRPTINPRLL